MNNKGFLYWCIIIFVTVLFLGCKVHEKENIKIKVKVKPRSTKFIVNKLIKNEFTFNTIAAKASVSLTDTTDKKTSFKTHLRIQKDSAIWMSITPLLGIEAARVLITKDSVKVMNRTKSEYFLGDFDYINKLFGTDLDYQMLEALLIANSLDFEMNDKIRSSVDRKGDRYYLSTEKKRKVRKEIKKEKEKIKEESQTLWLDPLTFKIHELLLSSLHSEKTLRGTYSNFKELEEQLVPYQMNFLLKSQKTLKIDVNYTKFTTGKALTFSFKIPSKYVQIEQ